MLAQISQFLGVDSSNFPLNEHIIIADKSKDGGFLIHYFLNICCKQNRPLCFISLAQSFNHYCTVAQKLGTNLHSARDNKNLVFIEGLRLISDIFEGDQHLANPFLQLTNGITSSLCDLILSSLKGVEADLDSSLQRSPVVIIDDLSVLLSLGVPTKFLVCFVKRLISFVTSFSPKASVVTSLNFSEGDSDEEEAWSCLSNFGTLTIEVSNLKSGHCKEVHGQIQVKWQDSYHRPRGIHSKKTQYRLLDKSIELFASGMSAAVL
ncbi:elongator complex protein 6 [Elysia marginata]|uniref:Elongator complex protein 6 n=1 Tax=Elysia marginata TaxID=1093978 RepID=A0AAV4HR25_9GAST|nr:elongator complex protein 6 [Elysia marginata]